MLIHPPIFSNWLENGLKNFLRMLYNMLKHNNFSFVNFYAFIDWSWWGKENLKFYLIIFVYNCFLCLIGSIKETYQIQSYISDKTITVTSYCKLVETFNVVSECKTAVNYSWCWIHIFAQPVQLFWPLVTFGIASS